MAAAYDLFPNETELTKAIFKAFNANADAIIKHFTLEDNLQMILLVEKMSKAKENSGFSLDSQARYTDPSNLVREFVLGYQDLGETQKPVFKKMANELADAIGAEEKRRPGALKGVPKVGDMMSLLGSDAQVREFSLIEEESSRG